jgi:glycerol-3-phosphate dehydrogenase (NAD(P)+)
VIENVYVIGAGAWGTALAQTAAVAGRKVVLCARNEAHAEAINTTRRNAEFLGEIVLSDGVVAQEGTKGVGTADLVIAAVPAQATRAALKAAREIGAAPVVLSAKGLERGTQKRQSEILAEVLPRATPFVLSGPSFAIDVAAGRPTAVTLAGRDADQTDAVVAALAGPSFRPYASSDIIGVELAGALKNVYALACGATQGAELGQSARAALIARSFAEMSRLVVAAGGAASTLAGLAGLGDLTLSCTTEQSRNFRFGLGLGRGGSVGAVAASGIGLAEGVHTASVAQALARSLGVEAPLIDAVNLLLAGSLAIDAIVAGLMSRPLKREDA